MANMSYCRFRNTLADLQDCYEHFSDDDLSEDEKGAALDLLALCQDIVADFT